jgi:hypothetical protein
MSQNRPLKQLFERPITPGLGWGKGQRCFSANRSAEKDEKKSIKNRKTLSRLKPVSPPQTKDSRTVTALYLIIGFEFFYPDRPVVLTKIELHPISESFGSISLSVPSNWPDQLPGRNNPIRYHTRPPAWPCFPAIPG